MKHNSGRKLRRQQQQLTITKGYGSHDKFAATHRNKRKKKANSN